MPTTNQLISAQTLTSVTGTVTFSSIPQTFTDLKLLVSARLTGNDQWFRLGFNDSTSGYRDKYLLLLEGTSVGSNSAGDQPPLAGTAIQSNMTANTFSNVEVYIPNYTSSIRKSYFSDGVGENNSTSVYSGFFSLIWDNTSAINKLNITCQGTSSFAIGSSFYLYGISSDTANQNTSGPYAFGGDTITTDGTYWYHTFLNSSSFVPQKNLSNVDYLVVAGGGGAGGDLGGGGGGGGLRCTVTATGGGGSLESKLSLTAGTVYAAIIGAGGAGNLGVSNGLNGSDSIFGTITSKGGGGGSGDVNSTGNLGGSGGGAASATGKTGGAGTNGQGYAGGNAITSGSYVQAGNGGGGAGGTGGTHSSGYVGGNGGVGVATSISGTSTYYAGGGGGGTSSGTAGQGGNGGGGAGVVGSNAPTGYSGSTNTGGGGGGGGTNGGDGGNGGSGIIIIRYPV